MIDAKFHAATGTRVGPTESRALPVALSTNGKRHGLTPALQRTFGQAEVGTR